MSAEREIKLKLTVENDQAIASTKEATKAVEGTVTAHGKVDKAAKTAGNTQADAAKAAADGQKLTAETLGMVATGFTSLIGLARQYSQIMEAAGGHRRELAKNFTSERDQLRELATVMDKVADTQFARDHAKLQAQSGMTPSEAMAFRSGFQNTGSQFKGSKINDKAYVDVERQLAQLAVAKGAPPEEFGELGARILGMKDRTGLGDKAPADILGSTYGVAMTLQHGSGRASILQKNFNELAASMQNEDAMRGVFQDPADVATAISVAAEMRDAQSFDLTAATVRGMRGFNDKDSGPLLARAKITQATPFFDALKQLQPIIEEETKATPGAKTYDTLKKYFNDEITARGIGVFLDKGIAGGLINERRTYAAQFKGSQPALDAIAAAEADPNQGVQLRKAEGEKRYAEMMKGGDDAQLRTIRAQAETRMERTGQTGTTGAAIGDMVTGVLEMTTDPRRVRTDQNALDILNDRMRATGYKFPLDDPARGAVYREPLKSGPENAEAQLKAKIEQITAAGGDPFRDMVPILKSIDSKLGTVTPAALPAAPPQGGTRP